MKKAYTLIGIALLWCAFVVYADDISPQSPQHADLEYVIAQKAKGALDQNDPAYQKLLEAVRQDALPGVDSPDQGNDFCPATQIPSLPYTDSGTTANMQNNFTDCGFTARDVIYEFTCPASGEYELNLLGSDYDTKLEVRSSGACPGDVQEACNDDYYGLLSAVFLNLSQGTQYFVIVDGYANCYGNYEINIFGVPPPPEPCDHVPDGVVYNPTDSSWTYRQTTDQNSVPPLYYGPFYSPSMCTSEPSGFGNYSWFDQDFGWGHYWADWTTPGLSVNSVQVLICAFDVDEQSCNSAHPNHPEACELDSIWADGVPTNPTYLHGDNNVMSLTEFDIPGSALLDDGHLNMFIDIDTWNHWCRWATTLSWSQLVVNYSVGMNQPPYTPTGHGMECASIDDDICVTITGPTPADPEGDSVTYDYRWFVANAGTGWGFVDDELHPNHPVNHLGNCVPSSDFDLDDIWRVQVYAVDSQGAQSLDPLMVDFPQVVQSCCEHNYPGDDCSEPYVIFTPESSWNGSFDLCGFCDDYDLSPCTGEPSESEDMVFRVTVASPDPQDPPDLYILVNPVGEWDVALAVLSDCGDFSALSCIAGADHNGPGLPEVCSIPSLPNGSYYIVVSGWTSDCGDFNLFVSSDYPLPVELTSFTGLAGDREARIMWQTASETNNDHFYLLRSIDNRNFSRITGDIPGTNSPTGGRYSYIDRFLSNGTTYFYKLADVDINGLQRVNDPVVAVTPFSGAVIVPEAYALHQNYPNPFNPVTTIAYDVKEAGYVTLTVFDIMGRVVATPVSAEQGAASYQVQFDASTLASGIYFFQLKVNEFSDLKKMVLLK